MLGRQRPEGGGNPRPLVRINTTAAQEIETDVSFLYIVHTNHTQQPPMKSPSRVGEQLIIK